MLQIEKVILSLDIIEKKFVCDLQKCKGACCVEGDSGAPLEDSEPQILDEIYPIVKPYLTKAGNKAINKQGKHIIDNDGEIVTPLIDNAECAYSVFENGIARCAIEKAYFDKKISFRKPISCHLYPIRITKYVKFDAVNYDKQEICDYARIIGENQGVPLYKFLKEVLVRKYGNDWYKQLEYAAENLKNK
jgi:hypothetical protein